MHNMHVKMLTCYVEQCKYEGKFKKSHAIDH